MAYHNRADPRVYHECRNCNVGNNIEQGNLVQGIPPGAKLCATCAAMKRDVKCIPGTPIPAR